MWGIEFTEAHNSLIVAGATFEVRDFSRSGRMISTLYRIGMGPHGSWIMRWDANSKWEVVNDHANNDDIEAILPREDDCGTEWTYRDFLLALTFWGEGHRLGYDQGESHTIERFRRQKKHGREIETEATNDGVNGGDETEGSGL